MNELPTIMSTRKKMPSYRPWGSTEDGNIEFESLTNETLRGALKVIRESFFPHESVSRAVHMTSDPGAMEELENLCLETARDGISVVAIDVTNGDVVGVAFNKIQVLGSPNEKTFFESFAENCKCKASKGLVNFMINVDSRVNLFKHYNVDCILEVMFLATLPRYAQRRIGELLLYSTIEIGRELKRGKKVKSSVEVNGDDNIRNIDTIPSLVSAEMTSRYSQKIAAKLGFERLLEVSYDEFQFEGKKFSEIIGPEHPSCVLVAKRLS